MTVDVKVEVEPCEEVLSIVVGSVRDEVWMLSVGMIVVSIDASTLTLEMSARLFVRCG